jgi:hypothetical protein
MKEDDWIAVLIAMLVGASIAVLMVLFGLQLLGVGVLW